MNLVGPVVDPPAARLHQHARERGLVGQPARAVHLDGTVDHIVEHLRREELDRRDLDPRLVAAVDLVRGVERHQAAGLDLGVAVGDPVLDRLLVGERAARRLALERVRAHQLERALHLAEPAHHVVDAPRAEPLLRDQEAGALGAERVRDRHADARVAHLAVRRPALAGVTHDRRSGGRCRRPACRPER